MSSWTASNRLYSMCESTFVTIAMSGSGMSATSVSCQDNPNITSSVNETIIATSDPTRIPGPTIMRTACTSEVASDIRSPDFERS